MRQYFICTLNQCLQNCALVQNMVFIDRVALAKQGDNGIGSVHPSVCPSVRLRALSCLNRLTYDLDLGARLCRVQQRAIRVITSPRCLSVCL